MSQDFKKAGLRENLSRRVLRHFPEDGEFGLRGSPSLGNQQ
jgi:hypothetical protein